MHMRAAIVTINMSGYRLCYFVSVSVGSWYTQLHVDMAMSKSSISGVKDCAQTVE